ncbi:hypothetical protein BDY24DRAFT_390543 [Mrakia frigida]|uniref:uncharacterized protein n=1 Tax=Mrakia frigida TaxID=29902 RepID=UPI003FCC272E
MSLNWTQVSTTGLEPVPLPEEKFVYIVEAADLTVVVPPTLQGPKNTLRASGKVWVSNQRIIFLSPTTQSSTLPPSFEPSASSSSTNTPSAPSTSSSSILQSSYSYISSLLPTPSSLSSRSESTRIHSLSIPLRSLHSLQFNQPILSPPSVSFVFSPTLQGGFPESATKVDVDVGVRDGKAWEFWDRVEKERVKARSDRGGRRREEGEGLPAYPGRQ